MFADRAIRRGVSADVIAPSTLVSTIRRPSHCVNRQPPRPDEDARAPSTPHPAGAAREIAVGIPKGEPRATVVRVAHTESVVRQGGDDAYPAELRVSGDGQQGAGFRRNHEGVRDPPAPAPNPDRPTDALKFFANEDEIQHSSSSVAPSPG